MKITKNKTFLKTPCKSSTNQERNEKIAADLFENLKHFGGIGLACNQIGINTARVCVINVKEPLILINPAITKKSDEKLIYMERCLSLPGKTVSTTRHLSVTVSADNLANERVFKNDLELSLENAPKDYGLLECVCVQHEIGHLDGKLMTDDDVRFIPPSKKSVKFGRNDMVMIERDGEMQKIKYKKLPLFAEQGWKMV